MTDKQRIVKQSRTLQRIAAFALGVTIGVLVGMLLEGCGGDIPTLPTLVFADDGGVDGGRP